MSEKPAHSKPAPPIYSEEEKKALRHSDINHPSIRPITIPLFTGEKLDRALNNYKMWSQGITESLGLCGLLDYALGESSPPDSTVEPRANINWYENDKRVCWYIATACSQSEKEQIKPPGKGAAAYWKAIDDRHKSDGPLTQIYLLQEALAMRMSDNESWTKTLTKAWDIADRAWAMGKIDLDVLKRILTVSLFEPYTDIQLPLMDCIGMATAEFPFTTSHLLKFVEERERVLTAKKNSPAFIALAAQSKGKNPDVCSNCNRLHHIAKYCVAKGGGMAGKTVEESKEARRKDKEAKPKGSKDSKASSSASNTPSATSTALFTSLPSVSMSDIDPDTFEYEDAGFTCLAAITPVEELTEDEPHKCSLNWDEYSRPQSNNATTLEPLNQREHTLLSTDACPFYLDSGASTHISPTRADFISLRPIPARPIQGVGGTSISAVAIGDIHLKSPQGQPLILQNALFVPNATVRLISVSVITRTAKAVAHFDDSSCWITSKSSNDLLARGSLLSSSQLYSLDLAQSVAEHAHSVTIPPTIETWHRRLGHANHQVVEDMARLKAGKGMPPSFPLKPSTCDSCILGKQTKSPVPKVRGGGDESRAKRILELLWIDLTGPMAVRSRTGNEYIMNIVDDYARKPFSVHQEALGNLRRAR